MRKGKNAVFPSRATRRLFALATLAAALLVLPPAGAQSYVKTSDISYDLGSPPSDPARNQLDIYRPETPSSGLRPFVLFIHGGGWRQGDKANNSMPDKAALFTGLGYGLVSINYRLSPMSAGPGGPDPDRIMFPDHPDDVGEAIGWLRRNALSYGLDPDRMILMGHSAGAHLASLVSVDPTYIERYGVDRRQILGTIPLDTGAFDIETSVLGTDSDEPSLLFMNAFGTPDENAASGSWDKASPMTWAEPSDPRHLFIVQNLTGRINRQLLMAQKLGQDATSVVPVPLNHEGINRAVGAPTDTTETTPAITEFVADRLAAYVPPRVGFTRRPPEVLRLARRASSRKPVRKKVTFAFSGTPNTAGFECRLGSAPFKSCGSSRRFSVGPGRYAFSVRPLYPSGRPGQAKMFKFRAVARQRR
jgi:hypothetical protein